MTLTIRERLEAIRRQTSWAADTVSGQRELYEHAVAALDLLDEAERHLKEVVRIASPFDECTPAEIGPAETDELFVSAFEALSALVGDGVGPDPVPGEATP